jgi:hypothetical protein
MKINKVLKISIPLFIIIIIIFFLFHNKIYYVKDTEDDNSFYDNFSTNDNIMLLEFPNVAQTLSPAISLETTDQRSNLVLCILRFYPPKEEEIKFKIKKMKLLVTDLKTNQFIDVKDIYLNSDKLTANKNQVVDHQIDFEIIGHHGFAFVEYYYNDFTYTTNEIRLNFDLLWEQGNKSYSYSKEYILKKKWAGFGFNICLD